MKNVPSKKSSRKPLLISVIEELRRQGYNQSAIAEMHGVSRQAVSWQKIEYDGELTPRQVMQKAWPWKTSAAHSKAKCFQRLRDLGEYMATGGEGMNDDKLKRLESWLRFMRENNYVLEFDPDLPPEVGVAPRGGFAYRQRVNSDGDDLLIRANEHTNLTPQGRRIWCFPSHGRCIVFVRSITGLTYATADHRGNPEDSGHHEEEENYPPNGVVMELVIEPPVHF